MKYEHMAAKKFMKIVNWALLSVASYEIGQESTSREIEKIIVKYEQQKK